MTQLAADGGLITTRRVSVSVWLTAIVAVSAVVRAVLAVRIPTPLYYPDEYIYSTLARSIAHTGLPKIRGSFVSFPALLGPYLMAPAWVVGGMHFGYRVAQVLGAVWFSTAAIPTYLLGRRVGLSSDTSLSIGAVALLVPCGALTGLLLSEPYAYPLFLWTILLAVRALAVPRRASQAAFLAAACALSLVRLQFVLIFAAYLIAAAFLHPGPRLRAAKSQSLVLCGTAVLALGAGLFGLTRVVGVYAALRTYHYPVVGVGEWAGADLFVLAIGVGWVVVPGALVGLFDCLRSAQTEQRAFALLAITLSIGLTLEAAAFGVNEEKVIERYAFYIAPLALIAFAWAVESSRRSRAVAGLSYAMAGLAILVPLTSILRGAGDTPVTHLDGAPSLFGFATPPEVLWAPLLGLLSVLIGLRVLPGRVVLLVAAGLLAVLSGAATVELRDRAVAAPARPSLSPPRGSTLVISAETDAASELRTLFWNPSIARVLVVGNAGSPDGFPSTPVTFAPSAGGFVAGQRALPAPSCSG